MGNGEVYLYDTRVGEVFGEHHRSFDDRRHWRIYENTRAFIHSGKDALATVAEICHQEGLKIVASVRMNSHYEMDPSSPSYSRFRRQHPELLIGHPPGYSVGSREHGIRNGLDYARSQVRRFMSDVVIELLERYPAFFKLHEAAENHHHMTELLETIRTKRDKLSRLARRLIELAVRVPPSLESALRVGLDVPTWIRTGLVDTLIAGGGFIPFDMPFEGFVKVAQETDCQVLGCLERLRQVTSPEVDRQVNRAIAMRYWRGGAKGLYLFNFHGQAAELKRQFFNEIYNRKQLAKLAKRYQIDYRRRPSGGWRGHGAAFSVAIPAVQLPVQLSEGDAGPHLRLRVDDDLPAARSRGRFAEARLRLVFDNFTQQDRIEVRLNGHILGKDSASQGRQFVEGGLEYGLESSPLRQGINTLQVRLLRRAPRLSGSLTLNQVEVPIQYH